MVRLQDRILVRKGGWRLGLKETPPHQSLEQVTSPQDPGPGEPPLRGRLGVEGASILTRCPEPETYQVNRHKMIRLRPWGAEWLAPSPTLSPTRGIIPFSSRNPDLPPLARTQTQVWTHLMEG